MRFTILTQYYPPEVGAAQTRLAAFARELGRHGHQVQVVTAMPSYPTGKVDPPYIGKFIVHETIDTIPVTRMWIYPATGRQILKRLANYFSFTFSCLFALFQVPHADILFVESPPLFLCLSAWLVASLRQQKLVINISDLWPDSVVALGFMQDGLSVRFARIVEAWLYRRAWRVCGVTEGIRNSIIAKGNTPKKIMLLPNGVDICQFLPKPYQSEPGKKKCLLYAGTHGYAHGVEVILQAAVQLQQRPDIEFLLVGDGADKLRLCQLAKELHLSNLRFEDPVPLDAMPDLLANSYAALVTVTGGSFFAGTRSAKLFPSMAAGRAILHSGHGEGAAIVQEAQCGIVTPPGDAQALAEAVLKMVDQPKTVATMGTCGRAFVVNHYSWHVIVDHWLKELGVENNANPR